MMRPTRSAYEVSTLCGERQTMTPRGFDQVHGSRIQDFSRNRGWRLQNGGKVLLSKESVSATVGFV